MMGQHDNYPTKRPAAVTPSLRTRHAELLLLCARIGYSPPAST
jgi:hypothetical protein